MLFESLYNQESLLSALKTNGIINNDSTIIPWHSDQLAVIHPDTGTIASFIYKNPIGGIDITDESMNLTAFTTENAHATLLMNPAYEHLAFVEHNSVLDFYRDLAVQDPLTDGASTIDGLDALESGELFSLLDILL